MGSKVLILSLSGAVNECIISIKYDRTAEKKTMVKCQKLQGIVLLQLLLDKAILLYGFNASLHITNLFEYQRKELSTRILTPFSEVQKFS